MNEQEQKAYVKKKAKEIRLICSMHKEFRGLIGEPAVKSFLLSVIKDCQVKINREWVYYFCAYINAGHKSPADDKARVEHAIKKLKEIGIKVTK